jgi:hypothetical protein
MAADDVPSSSATPHTQPDGFTYVSGFRYATDPATIADVKVGDTVHVTDFGPVDYWTGERRHVQEFDAVVENVAHDEFGIYLNNGGLPTYANSITHRIEITERAAP